MISSTFFFLAVVGLALVSFLIYTRTSKTTTFLSGTSHRATNRLAGSSKNIYGIPRHKRWQISGLESSTYRRLSQELIAGYQPTSQVTDFNAIDLDQLNIKEQLDLNTKEGFDTAFRIYTEGAYSKSVAEITLKSPVPDTVEIVKGIQVRGETASGDSVIGFFLEDYAAGETAIGIQYMTSDSQANYVDCRVGASPLPNSEGCLESSGTLVFSVKRVELPYTYNPLVDNVSKRSISSFSLNAEETMYQCENCPYKMFDTYYSYYGIPEYGNEIVSAAFGGRTTTLDVFNIDFSLFSDEAQGNIIKIATAHIVVWMEIIRRMEDAIDDCQSGCSIDTCNNDRVQSIDVAVALYTGSLEGTDGSGSGVFSYKLADEMCRKFKTCGDTADSTDGISKVNIEIFDNFNAMQSKLASGDCESSRVEKETIETLMLIPLIQGILESVYMQATAFNELSEAEGVGFSLAVAPTLYNCDKAADSILYRNILAKENVDFASIKATFESNFNCLGIDPAMVGGLYDSDAGAYFEGAEPSTLIATEEPAVPTVAPTIPEPSEDEIFPSSAPTTLAPTTLAPTTDSNLTAISSEDETIDEEAPISDTNSTSDNIFNFTDPEPSGNGSAVPSESPTTSSPTTLAPTTPSPSISVAPVIDTNSTSNDLTDPTPTTPAPSASVFPTEPTDQIETRGPTDVPTILSATPTVDSPTAAPELRSATIVDLIMGPTPPLEKFGRLPTPASLKYTSTNVQRPSSNRLPL